MSQLIDKLNQVSKTVPQPMGFTPPKSARSKPQMLLIASLAPSENVDNLAGYIAGADAVLLNFTKPSPNSKTLKRIAQILSGTPWGTWLNDVSEETIAMLIKAGSDFVAFLEESAVSALYRNEKLGKLLQLAPSLSADLLRMANELPIDAVLTAPATESTLTWRQLMLFQRLTNLIDKPILTIVPANLTTNELKPLWEAGVDGVIIEVGTEGSKGKLSELRQALDDPTFLPPRKHRKREALLPHATVEPESPTDEGDDGEEDE